MAVVIERNISERLIGFRFNDYELLVSVGMDDLQRANEKGVVDRPVGTLSMAAIDLLDEQINRAVERFRDRIKLDLVLALKERGGVIYGG